MAMDFIGTIGSCLIFVLSVKEKHGRPSWFENACHGVKDELIQEMHRFLTCCLLSVCFMRYMRYSKSICRSDAGGEIICAFSCFPILSGHFVLLDCSACALSSCGTVLARAWPDPGWAWLGMVWDSWQSEKESMANHRVRYKRIFAVAWLNSQFHVFLFQQ